MTKISRLALAAMLALGAGSVATSPALAKDKSKEAGAPAMKLSKDVQAPLAEAQKLVAANDMAGALAKIQAADAVKKTPDDAYMVNVMKLNVGITQKDNALIEQALEGALASGKVSAEDQPKFVRNLAALAIQKNDYPKAIAQYERLAQLTPNDPEVTVNLAELYQRSKNTPQAVATLRKAIDAKKASGQPVPEAWYRREVAIAYDAKLPETNSATQALVAAYPSPTNWRDALVIFRETGKLDDQANLDAMRLMRAANALNGERDYAEYAESAAQRGLPGEAKTVLDEGIAKNMLSSSKPFVKDIQTSVNPKIAADKASLVGLEKDAKGPKGTGKGAAATADGYLGYGQWSKAAELYKLALQKGGVDTAAVNTRLGYALAMSGDKAGAQEAFKAVQGSPQRQMLAQYWLIWANQKA